MAEYFVLIENGTVYVKEGWYFHYQGGDAAEWGKRWKRIEADSIEDARKKARTLTQEPRH